MSQSLFSSLPMGHTTLRNRIVMAPMTRSKSPSGVPTSNVVEYYRSRAKGQVGLIITEGTTISSPGSNGYPGVPHFYGEDALAEWQKVVEAVHAEGGAIAPQIWHVGPARRPGTEPDPTVPGFGPSSIIEDGVEVVKEMTHQDIAEAVSAFAQAAADAEALGFDAVEIHGAHSYLIDAFLWEGLNHRTDEYGGSLENRTRFAVEVVSAVRAKVSAEFPVIFRFSQWKQSDYSAKIAETPEDLGRILLPISEAGVDVFHASTRRFWEPAFENSDLTLAGWTKKITGKPAIAVGHVGLNKVFSAGLFMGEDPTAEPVDLTVADELFQKGEFDLLAVGRALLSDPDWVIKMEHHHLSEIHRFTGEALKELVF